MIQTDFRHAISTLKPLGRWLVNAYNISTWEHDTKTLPASYRSLRRKYRAFAREHLVPIALGVDRDIGHFDPYPLLKKAGRAGLLSEFMVKPIGSASFYGLLHHMTFPAVLKAEELTSVCGGLGLLILDHDLGVAPIMLAGDLFQYLKWMGKIAYANRYGDLCLAAFAITEPSAGSDVEDSDGAAKARLSTFARPVDNGYIINGRKVFISNGGIAKYITLFAAIKGEGAESWTCFLVDKDMKGFSVGRHEKKMGQRASDASELVLEDVFVPNSRVLGRVRSGWAINRNVLAYSRVGVAAISLGIARGALEMAIDFCKTHSLAGKRLMDYQDIQLAVADMMIDVAAARGITWQAARSFIPYQGATASAKVFASDTAYRVGNRAMELVGDYGYVNEYGIEKTLRDARLTQIYEGTNQVNRLALIEWQLDSELS